MTYFKPPVLAGQSRSDYENYLQTELLLALQKDAVDMVHRDELLFTIVHQTAELWLKLATSEVTEAIAELERERVRESLRLLRRVNLCVEQITGGLDMLERMSPQDYQHVRRALGHGSGFDSPGFNGLRKAIPGIWDEFSRLLSIADVSLLGLFLNDRDFEDLFQLAESMIEIDAKMMIWRQRHFQVIERSIGGNVRGTQGTPVEILGELSSFRFFPKLWEIRTLITNEALSQEK